DAFAHGHETGAGATDISHVVDKLSQTEQVGGALGGGGGVGTVLGDELRGGGVGGLGDETCIRDGGGHPVLDLLVGDRVGGQGADVGERGAGARHDGEGDLDGFLSEDLHVGA